MNARNTGEQGQHLLAEIQALVKAAAKGDSYSVGAALREVRPSPAAFWRFIRRIAPD